MAAKRTDRRGSKPSGGGPPRRPSKPKGAGPAGAKPSGAGQGPAPGAAHSVKVRKLSDGAWEIVLPRCARDRQEDIEEVRKMLDAGEVDVAVDECHWLLQGCSDLIDAHRILGEVALEDHDLPLARGHFGYAYRLVTQALAAARSQGPLPYRLAANIVFHESGKALAWCLKQLGHQEMAEEVVATMLRLDPSDPLGVRGMLTAPPTGDSAEQPGTQ